MTQEGLLPGQVPAVSGTGQDDGIGSESGNICQSTSHPRLQAEADKARLVVSQLHGLADSLACTGADHPTVWQKSAADAMSQGSLLWALHRHRRRFHRR